MESYIPTRPSSDLHRRLSARKKLPPAMKTRHHELPGPIGPNKQRSSSFSAIGQSLSRLLPSNRPEKGGTIRPMDTENTTSDGQIPPKILTETFSIRGMTDMNEAQEANKDDGDEMRRTKSWSPKKTSKIADVTDESHQPSKLKMPSTIKRLWELRRIAKADDGADGSIQCLNQPGSYTLDLPREEQKIQASSKTMESNTTMPSAPTAVETRSTVALKRSQQVFDEKAARREGRRSFRESEDYIGVQGVNPRTGYPDPSTATSSSAGVVVSEITRQKLQEDEKRMANASREYQAALDRRENEIKMLEMERVRQKKEKKDRADKKRAQLKVRAKKDGVWRNDGNTWSMVNESGLSPIVQSVAETPLHEPIAPHRILTAPVAGNGGSISRIGTVKKEDYLHLAPSPPKAAARHRTPPVESPSHAPIIPRDPSYHIESNLRRPQRSLIPLSTDSSSGKVRRISIRSHQNMTLPVRRKELGSATPHRRESSSNTVIHNIEIDQPLPVELPDNSRSGIAFAPPSVNPKVEITTPGEMTHSLSLMKPIVEMEHFLDITRTPLESRELQKTEVIATSYQSNLINQDLAHPLPLQNPVSTVQANLIHSLKDLPRVQLECPVSERVPAHTQSQLTPFPALVSNSIHTAVQQDIGNQLQGTTTPITTIGIVGTTHTPSSHEGLKASSTDLGILPLLMPASNRTPTSILLQREVYNGTPNSGSPMKPAHIATSLAHHLQTLSIPIKSPILNLPRPSSPKLEEPESKITLISTSMFPQWPNPSKLYVAAQSADQTTFLDVIPQRLGKEVKLRSSSLVSPKLRTKEIVERAGQGRKTFSLGSVDIGDLSRTQVDQEKSPDLLGRKVEHAKQLGGQSGHSGENEFIIWGTEIEKRVMFADGKIWGSQNGITPSLPIKELTEPQVTPTKDPQITPTKEPQSTPSEEPQSAPTKELQSTPTKELQSTPTKEPQSTPTKEPQSTPTKEMQSTPSEEPQSTPSEEPQSTPNKEMQSTPSEEPQSTPTKEMQSTPCKKPQGPNKDTSKALLLRKTCRMVMGAVRLAWWFVSPVFNPRSNLRWRWGRNELTWQDVLLIGAVGMFGGGVFLVMVLLARLVGVGLQILRGCIKVWKFLPRL